MKAGQRVQARASRGAERSSLMVVRVMPGLPGLVVTIDVRGQLALWSWSELVTAD